jgi:hypothetical protein
MKEVVHVILWIFVGAIVVLVLTHAAGFATATSAVGGQVTNDAFLLSGGGQQTGVSTPPGSWATAA